MRGRANVDDPREHVLAVAARLFYAEGIRAVGIERVQAESGVARATIYRHFPGKDAFVLAFIEQRDESWRAWLRERVEALSPEPDGRPLAVFDAIAERIRASAFVAARSRTRSPSCLTRRTRPTRLPVGTRSWSSSST